MWQWILTFIKLCLLFGAVGYSIALVMTTSLIELIKDLKQDKPKWWVVWLDLGLLISMALFSVWTFQVTF